MQIIKYSWQDRKPALTIVSGRKREKMELLGSNIDMIIGSKKCIGYFRDGRHFECRASREAEDRQCNECRLEDDYFFCIRCTGEQCINQKKRDECENAFYFVYLAAFDSLLKVGISQEFRIMERLIEQGADFGAKIARVQDGKIVRQIEQQIRKEINIVDRVTGSQKAVNLFCNPNVSAGNIFRAITLLRSNGMARHLLPTEIYDLREHYLLHKVVTKPRNLEIDKGVRLSGNIVAAKGNILVMRSGTDFYTVNAHGLIGREIEFLI